MNKLIKNMEEIKKNYTTDKYIYLKAEYLSQIQKLINLENIDLQELIIYIYKFWKQLLLDRYTAGSLIEYIIDNGKMDKYDLYNLNLKDFNNTLLKYKIKLENEFIDENIKELKSLLMSKRAIKNENNFDTLTLASFIILFQTK